MSVAMRGFEDNFLLTRAGIDLPEDTTSGLSGSRFERFSGRIAVGKDSRGFRLHHFRSAPLLKPCVAVKDCLPCVVFAQPHATVGRQPAESTTCHQAIWKTVVAARCQRGKKRSDCGRLPARQPRVRHQALKTTRTPQCARDGVVLSRSKLDGDPRHLQNGCG